MFIRTIHAAAAKPATFKTNGANSPPSHQEYAVEKATIDKAIRDTTSTIRIPAKEFPCDRRVAIFASTASAKGTSGRPIRKY
jgi:hypothetical protein